MSQEPVLFDTSIKENIRYGRTAVTDAEIHDACVAANAEFVYELPAGLDRGQIEPKGFGSVWKKKLVRFDLFRTEPSTTVRSYPWAQYVAKNGDEFATMMMKKQEGNPEYSFLKPGYFISYAKKCIFKFFIPSTKFRNNWPIQW